MNKKVLQNLSYGVYIVSTCDGDTLSGCTANSVMQITNDPVTISVSINHDNYTNEIIKKAHKFAISILPQEEDAATIGNFGFQSSKNVNKFANTSYTMVHDLPVLDHTCGYICCKVVEVLEMSTHTIFVGEAIAMDGFQEKEPMTYRYYHEVLKGTSPKTAPTYIAAEEKKTTKKRFKCKVCGYVYEGDFLPSDYRCPICGQPHTAFYELENEKAD